VFLQSTSYQNKVHVESESSYQVTERSSHQQVCRRLRAKDGVSEVSSARLTQFVPLQEMPGWGGRAALPTMRHIQGTVLSIHQ